METAFAIKEAMPVEVNDYSFQMLDNGSLQSIRLETEPFDLETAKSIKQAVDDNYKGDYNINLGPMRGMVQVRTGR